MIFIQPGTYDLEKVNRKTSFRKGTVYFRHGAKSEPGNSKDLKECIDREIERIRKSWLGNIRKVIKAPFGYHINVSPSVPSKIVESTLPDSISVRTVDDDPKTPAYRRMNPDETHPHRRKDVVEFVNQRLSGGKKITSYDIQCVRKIYNIEDKPVFYYKSKLASPQYSNAFVNWLVEQYKKDPLFFDKARAGCKKKK